MSRLSFRSPALLYALIVTSHLLSPGSAQAAGSGFHPGGLLAQASPSHVPEVTVEVTVTAPSRSAALVQVLTLGVDALLARAVTPGTPTAVEARQRLPDTLARVARILREQSGPQGVTLTALIALPAGAAERAVIAARPDLARTRVAVLIPESILRRPAPDPAAETELGRALVSAGLRVVDLSQMLRLSERERLRGGLSDEETRALGARVGADVLVTGEAFAEEYGAVVGGTRAYTSRLEVRVIDLSSGQILHTQAFQGSGIGATDAVAGKTALMNVGRSAGDVLPSALLRALQPGGVTAPRSFSVRVAPPVSFAPINTLAARLRAMNGVSLTSVRTLDAAGALLDVTYTGSAADLAALLETAGLSVTGLNGLELTARY